MYAYNISAVILAAVFVLIATRQIGTIRLQIWQIMSLGAAAVLITGQISPADALKAINPDVMIFLLSMFTLGEAMHQSGYLLCLSNRLFGRAKNADQLVLTILFGMGILSAMLMNDTLAIIGTPLVLYFAREYGISSKLLLLSLAFAVTIGSAMSPIGNPQNLLIAIGGGLSNPFISFFQSLFVPTMINLVLAYLALKLFYRDQFRHTALSHSQGEIEDQRLALASKISFMLLISLIALKVVAVGLGLGDQFKLTYIALGSALPVVILSERRFELMRKVDWHTLIFFAAMFVLMESVWRSGIFQSIISGTNADITSLPMILGVSIALSQLISNVPFVALYLPLLKGASVSGMMALAAGSTIAGNLLILGAASNVIIIQNAERQGETLTFMEFARVGIPLTIANAVVYWIFLV